MIVVSRHALARALTRLIRLSLEGAETLVRLVVERPQATRDVDGPPGKTFRRYGAVIQGVALVVTVDETDPTRRIVVSVRPGTCGSCGAGRGRRYRAARYVWERETWTRHPREAVA